MACEDEDSDVLPRTEHHQVMHSRELVVLVFVVLGQLRVAAVKRLVAREARPCYVRPSVRYVRIVEGLGVISPGQCMYVCMYVCQNHMHTHAWRYACMSCK